MSPPQHNKVSNDIDRHVVYTEGVFNVIASWILKSLRVRCNVFRANLQVIASCLITVNPTLYAFRLLEGEDLGTASRGRAASTPKIRPSAELKLESAA